jgi:hypothetical protein
MFSDPLPDSVVSSETAAPAAAMIIAGSSPDIANFAARVAGAPDAPRVDAPKPRKRIRARPKRSNGRVREAPDQCDERLIATMKANPGASIGKLAEEIGKSRTTTVTALRRLRDADLAESVDRVGSLIEPVAPKLSPKWVPPLGAQSSRRHHVEPEEHAPA